MKRTYDSSRREEKSREFRNVIADAAATVWSEKGGMRISFAEVAKLSGASLPTVYKYFKSREELLSYAAPRIFSRAPALSRLFADQAPAVELARKLLDLVVIMNARHAALAPWRRWHDEPYIPSMAEFADAERAALKVKFELATRPDLTYDTVGVASALSLLSFDAWLEMKTAHEVEWAGDVADQFVGYLIGLARESGGKRR